MANYFQTLLYYNFPETNEQYYILEETFNMISILVWAFCGLFNGIEEITFLTIFYSSLLIMNSSFYIFRIHIRINVRLSKFILDPRTRRN